MTKRVSTPLAVLLLGLAPMAQAAPPKRVTAHVKGMACPFCVYNIEKRIETLEAVPDDPDYEASVDEGWVRFDWKARAPLDKDAIRAQIEKAGFSPGPIEVREAEGDESSGNKKKEKTISGKAALTDEAKQKRKVLLHPGESEPPLQLAAADRKDRNASHEALTRYLARTEDDGAPAEVTVRGRPARGDTQRLILHSWTPRRFEGLLVLRIDELACEHCAAKVTKALRKREGVIHAEADFEKDTARVWFHETDPDLEAVRKAVAQAGFEVTHVHARPTTQPAARNEHTEG